MWVWDHKKNEDNRRKHKLSFETATLAFSDPLSQTYEDPFETEVRWRTYGMIAGILVLVVHTEPEGSDEETMRPGRIISARKATSAERRAFEENSL